jgi:formate hydrogenlyase subunit 3/multisubunit Na+/H+ antiporter MnhD subunit
VMLGAGDGCLLLGIGIFWFLQKTFSVSGPRLPVDGLLPGLAFLLMLAGAIAKAGGMPLHTWIPAASRGAPATVMALLPGAIDKLLGIYLIVRLVTGVFALGSGMGMMLMILGSVTVIAAVMVAMVQHDLRRLLSYHAVSQVGYMVLGIGTLTPIGLVGGLFHMLNNAVYKSCLFLGAGAVEKEAGTTDLDELGGLAKAMPGTFSAVLVAALAISGVPPLNGFVSKWLVYQGTIVSGSPVAFLFLVTVMFGSGLTLASFMKVIYAVFLGRMSERTRQVKRETSAAMLVPMVVLALLCVAFGVFYAFPLTFLVLPGVSVPLGFAGIWDSSRAAAFLAGGFVLGILVLLAGRIGKMRRVPSFVGGEKAGAQVSARVAASRFYDTIRSLPLLSRIYDAQERGVFDPHVQIGRIGAGLVGFLRRLHGGNLLWYLAWSFLGTGILLVLFVVFR